MRQIILALLLSPALLAQNAGSLRAAEPPESASSGPAHARAQPSTASSNDELARMRDDLNKLESLNQNMSSEIEFLNNQNLQILLRTNVQMWRIVIGDLRQQIEREERGRAAPPQSPAPASRPR